VSAMPTKMLVAADTVAFRSVRPGDLDVLLVERANEPFRGCWALPGGFVEEDEDLPQAAARELSEETGLAPAVMDQVGAWGTPGRDPRGRVVSAVYLAVARPGQDRAEGGDDAARAAWHPVDGLPHLAFDHAEIVPAALRHLRRLCERTHAAFAFLGEPFGEPDVAAVLGALGAREPGKSAQRLLAAACVEAGGAAGAATWRLTTTSHLAPLRQSVLMFSALDTFGD